MRYLCPFEKPDGETYQRELDDPDFEQLRCTAPILEGMIYSR